MLTSTDLTTTGGDDGGETVNSHRFVLDHIAHIAQDSGSAAYLVGGPVRDRLLGRPTVDLDITVVGDAPAVAARLASDVGGRLTVHQRFGTATVAAGSLVIDLVSARRETYSSPGALPDVRSGTILDDLARRDFTINAMAMPLAALGEEPVDPHGGRSDLISGLIRALHPGSFRDDPTRMLRAVRYAARFGFRIEPVTASFMSAGLDAGAMATITEDRVRHELERIFEEPDPVAALRLAEERGVLQAIHPALAASHLPRGIDDPIAPLTWLSALAWPLSPQQGDALCARLNAPAEWARVVTDTARVRDIVPALSGADHDALKPSAVCALLDGLAPGALRGGILMTGSAAAGRIQRYLGEWWSVAPRLRGNDLLAMGIPPGPAVGAALRELRRARLDGETASVQDEENVARRWAVDPDKIAC